MLLSALIISLFFAILNPTFYPYSCLITLQGIEPEVPMKSVPLNVPSTARLLATTEPWITLIKGGEETHRPIA